MFHNRSSYNLFLTIELVPCHWVSRPLICIEMTDFESRPSRNSFLKQLVSQKNVNAVSFLLGRADGATKKNRTKKSRMTN